MVQTNYEYIIVGAGLAGASAAEGIREHDKEGTILMVGSEPHAPYHRPPLTKKLWFNQETVADIFLHESSFYANNGVTLKLATTITEIDPKRQTIRDRDGIVYGFNKLLLATGGVVKKLAVPGGSLEGIFYLRTLDDYLKLRDEAVKGATAVVVGGGFIGAEIAAALSAQSVQVTMVLPEEYLGARIFPSPLGEALTEHYFTHGIRMVPRDRAVAFEMRGDKYFTHTKRGKKIESDLVVIGAGIAPAVDLAKDAGLLIENGIAVNQYLQTSHPRIFAAGDNACFPYFSLGQKMRIEHWDNARSQGRYAGRNMVAVEYPYDYLPYFYSDLFKFGYEAVGDINTKLQTFAYWTKENDTGTIYYLKDGKVRGAMMCNVWQKVDEARDLIRLGARLIPPDEMHQAI